MRRPTRSLVTLALLALGITAAACDGGTEPRARVVRTYRFARTYDLEPPWVRIDLGQGTHEATGRDALYHVWIDSLFLQLDDRERGQLVHHLRREWESRSTGVHLGVTRSSDTTPVIVQDSMLCLRTCGPGTAHRITMSGDTLRVYLTPGAYFLDSSLYHFVPR